MIIQCKQCATKFRFKDELMTGDGVWVRCGRCGHEFFEINAKADAAAAAAGKAIKEKTEPAAIPGADTMAPREEPAVKPLRGPESAAPAKILTPADVISKPLSPADDVVSEAEVIKPFPAEEEEVETDTEEEEHEARPRTPFWTTSRLIAYSILVFLVVGGVYLWLNPGITRDVLNVVSPGAADRLLGPVPSAPPAATAGGINFAEVRERFTKSTTSGEILVISGLAVNEYDYPVARLKLRGKILDNTGKVLGEVETYAGNLLTDDELNRLTDKEVLAELQKPEGSDMPNTNIRPRASIPFMIVFMNPPKEVDEFIIELSAVERAPASN